MFVATYGSDCDLNSIKTKRKNKSTTPKPLPIMDPNAFHSAYAPSFARKGRSKILIKAKPKTKAPAKAKSNESSKPTKSNDPQLDDLLGGFVIGDPPKSSNAPAPAPVDKRVSLPTEAVVPAPIVSPTINYIENAHVDIVELKGTKYYFYNNKFYTIDTGKLAGSLKSGLIYLEG